MKLLAIRIVEAIAASPLLEDNKKLLALNDLLEMYKDPKYGDDVLVDVVRQLNSLELNLPSGEDCSSHHLFHKSKLGENFWWKMQMIIGIV